jgi:hypothetical protein
MAQISGLSQLQFMLRGVPRGNGRVSWLPVGSNPIKTVLHVKKFDALISPTTDNFEREPHLEGFVTSFLFISTQILSF